MNQIIIIQKLRKWYRENISLGNRQNKKPKKKKIGKDIQIFWTVLSTILKPKTTEERMWDILHINWHFSKNTNKNKNLKKCNHQMSCRALIRFRKINYKDILGTILKKIWIFEIKFLGNEKTTVNYLMWWWYGGYGEECPYS